MDNGSRMYEAPTIGRLAQLAGVNVETIRYYERRGLLDRPPKPAGGHRRYPSSAVSRMRFIRRAQQLGFTLDEVAELLRLEDGRSCRETRELARRKLTLIEARIDDLARMRRTLERLIAQCAEGRRPRSCPIIATLSAGD